MSVPASAVYVRVTGRWVDQDGNPKTGTVVLIPSTTRIIDPGDDVIIGVDPVVATLDDTGAIGVTLLATDTPQLAPTGWTWQVTERISGAAIQQWSMALPYTNGTVDLADVAPAAASTGLTSYATQAAMTTLAGRVQALEDEVIPDATGTVNGLVRLTGDLGGTATSPTVPGLAGKAAVGHTHTAGEVSGVETPAGTASAIAEHTGASDPHGDRAAAAAALNAHAGVTTGVHGIADTAALETTTGATAKVTAHIAATDPHGDRAAATAALTAHIAASDPHGDRAYTDGALAARTPSTQTFTSSGTWTKPAGAVLVEVHLVGGGGGGGGGRRGAAASVRCGGGGGGGGGFQRRTFLASELSATVSVTVGAGGAGAGAQSSTNANGAGGSSGGPTLFGTYTKASAGSGGGGGTASAGSTGNAGVPQGVPGASASTTGGAGFSSYSNLYGSGGGGAGGGITSADVAGNGGLGAARITDDVVASAGVVDGALPGVGPSVDTGLPMGGGGGSGGAASITTAAQTGANGGLYGGGGGGGGAGLNTAGNGGGGGAGAQGAARVVTYF